MFEGNNPASVVDDLHRFDLLPLLYKVPITVLPEEAKLQSHIADSVAMCHVVSDLLSGIKSSSTFCGL